MFGIKRKEFEDWVEGFRTRLAINSREIDDFSDRFKDNHDDHVSFLKEIDRIDEEIHHINDKIDIITKCISTPINATEPVDKVKKCLEGGITLENSILEKIIIIQSYQEKKKKLLSLLRTNIHQSKNMQWNSSRRTIQRKKTTI